MKYIILSISDSRSGYVAKIREALGPENEIPFEAVDGRDPERVAAVMAEFPEIFYDGQKPIFHDWEYKPKVGEVGVWLSNLLAWKAISQMNEPCMVIEDDAIPRLLVLEKLQLLMDNVREDFGFVPLYTPDDCIFLLAGESFIGMEPNPVVARVYQTYCHVAMLYSPDGASRLLRLAAGTGILAPVDIFTMQAGKMGLINGYAFQNHDDLPFTYNWAVPTTIHDTEPLQWK